MLETLKQFITLKSIDSLIKNKHYDIALEKLNFLIQNGFHLEESYLKRGSLCHVLLMNENAYSDFTYVITHYSNISAYIERMYLNFEIENYYEAILDSEAVLVSNQEFFGAKKIKFLSLVYLDKTEESKDFILSIFDENKFRAIQFLLNETASLITKDELAHALKILGVIDLVDYENPMKLLKEANIYSLAGENEKQNIILNKIESIFPKYFISHYKFGDIYESRDLLEICFLLELRVFDKHNLFEYQFAILDGYKNNLEGHIIDSKESFERAIQINPDKPDAYVLLGETLQLMSGYDNKEYKSEAESNYQKALELYEANNVVTKAEAMKRQIKHLNSGIIFGR